MVLCHCPLFIRPGLAWRGGTESPLWGGTSFLPPPAQVAQTGHSKAVADSGISLLDAEGTPMPPRVYMDELRPIPRDWRSWRSLEILLQKQWVPPLQ